MSNRKETKSFLGALGNQSIGRRHSVQVGAIQQDDPLHSRGHQNDEMRGWDMIAPRKLQARNHIPTSSTITPLSNSIAISATEYHTSGRKNTNSQGLEFVDNGQDDDDADNSGDDNDSLSQNNSNEKNRNTVSKIDEPKNKESRTFHTQGSSQIQVDLNDAPSSMLRFNTKDTDIHMSRILRDLEKSTGNLAHHGSQSSMHSIKDSPAPSNNYFAMATARQLRRVSIAIAIADPAPASTAVNSLFSSSLANHTDNNRHHELSSNHSFAVTVHHESDVHADQSAPEKNKNSERFNKNQIAMSTINKTNTNNSSSYQSIAASDQHIQMSNPKILAGNPSGNVSRNSMLRMNHTLSFSRQDMLHSGPIQAESHGKFISSEQIQPSSSNHRIMILHHPISSSNSKIMSDRKQTFSHNNLVASDHKKGAILWHSHSNESNNIAQNQIKSDDKSQSRRSQKQILDHSLDADQKSRSTVQAYIVNNHTALESRNNASNAMIPSTKDTDLHNQTRNETFFSGKPDSKSISSSWRSILHSKLSISKPPPNELPLDCKGEIPTTMPSATTPSMLSTSSTNNGSVEKNPDMTNNKNQLEMAPKHEDEARFQNVELKASTYEHITASENKYLMSSTQDRHFSSHNLNIGEKESGLNRELDIKPHNETGPSLSVSSPNLNSNDPLDDQRHIISRMKTSVQHERTNKTNNLSGSLIHDDSAGPTSEAVPSNANVPLITQNLLTENNSALSQADIMKIQLQKSEAYQHKNHSHNITASSIQQRAAEIFESQRQQQYDLLTRKKITRAPNSFSLRNSTISFHETDSNLSINKRVAATTAILGISKKNIATQNLISNSNSPSPKALTFEEKTYYSESSVSQSTATVINSNATSHAGWTSMNPAPTVTKSKMGISNGLPSPRRNPSNFISNASLSKKSEASSHKKKSNMKASSSESGKKKGSGLRAVISSPKSKSKVFPSNSDLIDIDANGYTAAIASSAALDDELLISITASDFESSLQASPGLSVFFWICITSCLNRKCHVINLMILMVLLFAQLLYLSNSVHWSFISLGFFYSFYTYYVQQLFYPNNASNFASIYLSLPLYFYTSLISRSISTFLAILWYFGFITLLLQSDFRAMHKHLIVFSVTFFCLFLLSTWILTTYLVASTNSGGSTISDTNNTNNNNKSTNANTNATQELNYGYSYNEIIDNQPMAWIGSPLDDPNASMSAIICIFLCLIWLAFIFYCMKIHTQQHILRSVEREIHYNSLIAAHNELRRELRQAQRIRRHGDDKKITDAANHSLNLEAPLSKVLRILSEIQQRPGISPDVRSCLQFVQQILPSPQLLAPNLDTAVDNMDGEVHRWIDLVLMNKKDPSSDSRDNMNPQHRSDSNNGHHEAELELNPSQPKRKPSAPIHRAEMERKKEQANVRDTKNVSIPPSSSAADASLTTTKNSMKTNKAEESVMDTSLADKKSNPNNDKDKNHLYHENKKITNETDAESESDAAVQDELLSMNSDAEALPEWRKIESKTRLELSSSVKSKSISNGGAYTSPDEFPTTSSSPKTAFPSSLLSPSSPKSELPFASSPQSEEFASSPTSNSSPSPNSEIPSNFPENVPAPSDGEEPSARPRGRRTSIMIESDTGQKTVVLDGDRRKIEMDMSETESVLEEAERLLGITDHVQGADHSLFTEDSNKNRSQRKNQSSAILSSNEHRGNDKNQRHHRRINSSFSRKTKSGTDDDNDIDIDDHDDDDHNKKNNSSNNTYINNNVDRIARRRRGSKGGSAVMMITSNSSSSDDDSLDNHPSNPSHLIVKRHSLAVTTLKDIISDIPSRQALSPQLLNLSSALAFTTNSTASTFSSIQNTAADMTSSSLENGKHTRSTLLVASPMTSRPPSSHNDIRNGYRHSFFGSSKYNQTNSEGHDAKDYQSDQLSDNSMRSIRSASTLNHIVERSEKHIWRLLENVDSWDWNVFELTNVTQGRPLQYVGMALFRYHRVFETFQLPENKAKMWLIEIENGYLSSNPYHNSIHAADVAQTMHFFLSRKRLQRQQQQQQQEPHEQPSLQQQSLQQEAELTVEERFAAIVACIIHDYQHPGVNNSFMIASRSNLAVRYNDRAVLESFHVASMFELMRRRPEIDIFSHLSADSRRKVRELIISMVLATDISEHFELLGQFSNRMSTRGIDFSDPADRKLVLMMGTKAADISNPAKSSFLSLRWTSMIMDEFYQQAEREAKEGLPISAFMKRGTNVPKFQMTFINTFAKPLIDCWASFFKGELSEATTNINLNLEHWRRGCEESTQTVT